MRNEQVKNFRQKSYLRLFWMRFKRHRLSLMALMLVKLLLLIAIFAPLIANDRPNLIKSQGNYYSPTLAKTWPFKQLGLHRGISDERWQFLILESESSWMPWVGYSPLKYNLDEILEAPSTRHYMGTDDQGRDILARMIHGTRISLLIGFIAVFIYVMIGVVLGSLAGYFGGRTDWWISRFIEVMICFPAFFLILTIISLYGGSLFYMMVVIGITSWPGIARLVRAEFLKNRNSDYVAAAQIQGQTNRRIIFRQLLPNSMAPVLVSATFGVASTILIESSLSFLGFGVQPPTPTWGSILATSREFLDLAWWLSLFPGIAIFATIWSFQLIGEGLRDALDPRSISS